MAPLRVAAEEAPLNSKAIESRMITSGNWDWFREKKAAGRTGKAGISGPRNVALQGLARPRVLGF